MDLNKAMQKNILISEETKIDDFGSEVLNEIVSKLKKTKDHRKKYEYVLWLAKKIPLLSEDQFNEKLKVKGCISNVYVSGKLIEGRISWQGYSDALITKGLLSLLIKGLNNLRPEEVIEIDPRFIEETGLRGSLTPSRANGFLNILLAMKAQANFLSGNIRKDPAT